MGRHHTVPATLRHLLRKATLPALTALALSPGLWTMTGHSSSVRGESGRGESARVPRPGGELSRSATAALLSPSSLPSLMFSDGSPSPSSSPSSSPSGAARPSTSPSPQRSTADPDQVLAKALGGLAKSTSASFSVALVDLKNGREAGYGAGKGHTYDTASIVKVDILVALLLTAQDENRPLTAAEKACATSMIKVSDNTSADTLWRAIGGSEGLDAANRRLGMTGTTAGRGALWGLTQSTAADQLVLLSAVFGEASASPLNAASRNYVRGLMGGIADGQDWGVSAAGTAAGLKNGWLPRSATGLWDVNSIGRIVVDGRGYLLAVLSKGSVSMAEGVSLVEKAATIAVSASRQWS
jgi:hypothetical protein